MKFYFLVVLAVVFASCSQPFDLPLSSDGVNPADSRSLGLVSKDFAFGDILTKHRADLTFTQVKVLDFAHNSITYQYTVVNNGTAAADKNKISVQGVISADLVFFNGGDVPAGGSILSWTGQILPGESVTKSFTCSLPSGTLHPETAVQYLLLKVDYSNQISESNENNNIGFARIYPKKPELSITSASCIPEANRISYTFTLVNSGMVAADVSGSTLQAYISTGNTTLGGGDIPAGGLVIGAYSGQPSLAPGSSVTISFSCSLPTGWRSTTQPQYLLLFADYNNAVDEIFENNNQRSVYIP